MGHHLFVRGEACLPVRDWTLEFIRCLLVISAQEMGLGMVAEAVEKWENVGGGVWLHVKEATLLDNPALLTHAVALMRSGRYADKAHAPVFAAHHVAIQDFNLAYVEGRLLALRDFFDNATPP